MELDGRRPSIEGSQHVAKGASCFFAHEGRIKERLGRGRALVALVCPRGEVLLAPLGSKPALACGTPIPTIMPRSLGPQAHPEPPNRKKTRLTPESPSFCPPTQTPNPPFLTQTPLSLRVAQDARGAPFGRCAISLAPLSYPTVGHTSWPSTQPFSVEASVPSTPSGRHSPPLPPASPLACLPLAFFF